MTDELLDRLDELRAELKVRDRPERRAWARLEPTRDGWPARPYDEQAIELWENVLRGSPDDLASIHHLAIAHHARAIDLEQSEHPDRSDDDWRRALVYWHRLIETEEFWTGLAERQRTDSGKMPKVRQDLVVRLLQIHFDIALDEHSPNHRVRFHIRFALDAPFLEEVIEQVRVRTYEKATSGMDAAVWRSGHVEPSALQLAIDTVTGYLDKDDGCKVALVDLLKLLNRQQNERVLTANAADPDESRRVCAEITATARRYDSYLTRLEPLLTDPEDQDAATLSDLSLWHGRTAGAYERTDDHLEAAGHYERAYRAACAARDPRSEEMGSEWALSTALAARDRAGDDAAEARRLLAVETVEDLPGLALLIRAQALLDLGEYDQADDEARQAETLFEAPGNMASPELRDACRRVRALIRRKRLAEQTAPHLDKARAAMDEEGWEAALEPLNTVLAIDADSITALLWRATCLRELYETTLARADLTRAEELFRLARDDDGLDAVRKHREVLDSIHQHVAACGGPKPCRLRQEGVRAFNEGRRVPAIGLLREALAAAGGTNQKIAKDLASCLADVAAADVAPTFRALLNGPLNPSTVLRNKRGWLASLEKAEGMLIEALMLDPGDGEILKTLTSVRSLHTQLKGLG
jgi:tetratricopeptide (TPR) repeat protein